MKYESTASYSKSKFSLVKIKNKIYIKKKPNKIDEREFQSIQKQNNFIPFKVNNYDVIAAKIISKKKKNQIRLMKENFNPYKNKIILFLLRLITMM